MERLIPPKRQKFVSRHTSKKVENLVLQEYKSGINNTKMSKELIEFRAPPNCSHFSDKFLRFIYTHTNRILPLLFPPAPTISSLASRPVPSSSESLSREMILPHPLSLLSTLPPLPLLSLWWLPTLLVALNESSKGQNLSGT